MLEYWFFASNANQLARFIALEICYHSKDAQTDSSHGHSNHFTSLRVLPPLEFINIALQLQLTCMLRSAIYVPMTIIIAARISIPFYQRSKESERERGAKCMHEQQAFISFWSCFLHYKFSAIDAMCVGKLCKLQDAFPHRSNGR